MFHISRLSGRTSLFYLPQDLGPKLPGLEVANTHSFLWAMKQESLEMKITTMWASLDTDLLS